MSRPHFISIKTSHAEEYIQKGWHGNALVATGDYLYALGHFAGAMVFKLAEVGMESIRDAVDRK